MSTEDVAVRLLGAAAELSPLVLSFVQGAIAGQPGHPLTKRVAEVLPAKSASRAALEDLAELDEP